MKSRGMMFKTLLSGVALIGLLSLFVVPADSSTEVYSVPARFMKHTAGAQASLTQCFRATCDSILTLSFFNGWHPGAGTFTAELKDSASGFSVWNGSWPTAESLAYRNVGFTVNKGVGRGKTYKLIIGYTWNPSGPNYYFDAYFDTTNAYKYGKIEGYGDSVDLCARIRGVNRTDSTFWGVGGETYGTNLFATSKQVALITKAKEIGIAIDREQIQWEWLQPKRDSFAWYNLDTLVQRAQAQGLRLMLNVYGTPAWASTDPDTVQNSDNCNPDSTGKYLNYPPRNLDHGYGWQDSNYLWKFLDTLTRRYSAMGVHDYEIYNEVNNYNAFRYGKYRDTLFYNAATYPRTPAGRAQLYVKACQVAYNAIKNADLQATVYTNALGSINLSADCEPLYGRQWLQYFYDAGGKNYSDVITYHWYLWDTEGRHKFVPSYFIGDYDTLRRVMRDNGDGTKPVWADEGGYGTPDTVRDTILATVSRAKQADIAVQATVTGLGQRENANGPRLDQMNWYKLYNRYDAPGSPLLFYHWAGLLDSASSPNYKPSAYAYKQMKAKLTNLNFNKRVIRPDPKVWCYEFQIPDSEKAWRTWCLWRSDSLQKPETLSIRTNTAFLYTRDTSGVADSSQVDTFPGIGGKVVVPYNKMDSIPRYLREVGAVIRPDVVVDSLWHVPTNPRAGDGVWFYARLKNVGNAALSSSIWNSVTFQVDGVSKKTYQIQQQLPVDSSIVLGGDVTADWQANYGDHLIRAWADSADRYVELNEANNTAYLFRHMAPSGKLIIPATGYNQGYPTSGRKFSNVRPVKLSTEGNGSTIPFPDSVRIKNSWEGTWRPWRGYADSYWDTLSTGDEMKWVWAQWKMANGETSATEVDSIILDTNPPYADISTPIWNQTVSGNVLFKGNANDWYEHHLSYWKIACDTSTNPWCSGTDEVGMLNPVQVPDTFGIWNSRSVPNGYHKHYLTVNDSAGNESKDSVRVRVRNNQTNSGDSWASNFGTLSSAPMNVVTDPTGNLYIAETQNSKVRKYSPRKDSLFAFSAKRGNDSTGLNWAVSMALKDSTTLYIADGYGHCIKRFDRQGNLLLRIGSFGTNPGQFRQPCGIALDHKRRLFVVDRLNHRVQVFSDSTGDFLFQFGSQGSDSTQFSSPTGITITPNGFVWISDTRNNRIQVYQIDTVSLAVRFFKTIRQVDSLGLDTPLGICSDKWGDVFVADALHNRIVELNPYGERIFDFGGLGDSLCQFRTPVGVACSPGGHHLYVADMGNKRVQKFIVIEEDTTGGGPQGREALRLPPKITYLDQSYPNPTTGEALIAYGLAQESDVRLTIYNVAGQVVREYNQGKQKAGYYSITWDGRSNLGHRVGAGVYFYRLEAGTWAKTRKMVVIR